MMMEYHIEEAEQLLTKNLETAVKNLIQIDTDLDFLRDQITTSEVRILFKQNDHFSITINIILKIDFP